MCRPADTFSETVLYKYKKDNPPRPVKEDTNDWRGGKIKRLWWKVSLADETTEAAHFSLSGTPGVNPGPIWGQSRGNSG